MLQRRDFQKVGAQHLKVSSFVTVGAPKHDECFKHVHECFWAVFLAVLRAFANMALH